MTFSVFLNTNCSLSGTPELDFGLRDLRRILQANPDLQGWHEFDGSQGLCAPRDLIEALGSDQVLVVLNPALIVSDNLLGELSDLLRQHPQSCIVPADPRRAHGEWQIDYASRAGFERYVARRQAMAAQQTGDEQPAWIYWVNRCSLLALLSESPALSWEALARHMPDGCFIAQRAFVHSYADYQKSARPEILRLIPASVRKLMDVGGGEGGFLSAYQKERSGEVLLVEPNIKSAAAARGQGLAVLNERFESVAADKIGRFDCISFLDVLEHFENPLGALTHAHSLLSADGFVVLSVPNVGHWSVVQDLLQGRFDYLPLGILCCTHLRFFTERSLRQLVSDAGFKVQKWLNQPSPMPAALAQALGITDNTCGPWNMASLSTDSFHVLASRHP